MDCLVAVTDGGYNVGMGSSALRYTTGSQNTAVGQQAGKEITTGSKNTILGRYNGNQGGLDIRTSSNNIVLSDGDGNPRMYIDGSATAFFGCFANPTTGVKGNSIDGQGQMRCSFNATSGNALVFYTTSGQAGSVALSGTSTSYNTSSDYRLKENVVPMSGATERLKQLKPSRFSWVHDPDKTVDGFLAHEVSSIVPEAISGEKDAVDDEGNPVYQGIDQSKLVPLLVATIQELEARIAALESN